MIRRNIDNGHCIVWLGDASSVLSGSATLPTEASEDGGGETASQEIRTPCPL